MLIKKKTISWNELWIILIIVNSLGFPGNFTDVLGDMFETVIDYLIIVLKAYLIFRYSRGKLFTVKKRHVPFLLFGIVVCVESLLVTNYIGLQIISLIQLCLTIAFAVALSDEYPLKRILELFCNAQTVFLLLTVLYMFIDWEGAFQDTSIVTNAFTGLFSTKNNCASELACGIILTSLLAKCRRKSEEKIGFYLIAMIIVQIVAIAGCQATGPIICVIVTILFMFAFSKKRLHPGVFVWVVSIGFLAFALTLLPVFENLLSLIGKDITLTGRTDMWGQILEVITSTHTFTGYGFAMFWRDPEAYSLVQNAFSTYSFLGNMTSGSHNMVLDLWLNIGLIGLVLLIVISIYLTNKYRRMTDEHYWFVFTYLVYFTMHGLSERAFDPSNYLTLLFFVALAVASISYQPNYATTRMADLRDIQMGEPDHTEGII